MIKKLGTPTEDEVNSMNPDYQNKQLPKVMGVGWENMFDNNPDPLAVDLVAKMLTYDPSKRIGLYKAMTHPLFNELREDELTLPNGNCIPDLFSFTEKEKQEMGGECRDVLIPEWYDPLKSPGIHVLRDTGSQQNAEEV